MAAKMQAAAQNAALATPSREVVGVISYLGRNGAEQQRTNCLEGMSTTIGR